MPETQNARDAWSCAQVVRFEARFQKLVADAGAKAAEIRADGALTGTQDAFNEVLERTIITGCCAKLITGRMTYQHQRMQQILQPQLPEIFTHKYVVNGMM